MILRAKQLNLATCSYSEEGQGVCMKLSHLETESLCTVAAALLGHYVRLFLYQLLF